jgi:hypothetical protein
MLLTDIEGSTRILQEIGDDRYGRLLADHHRLVIGAGRAHGAGSWTHMETQCSWCSLAPRTPLMVLSLPSAHY